MLGRLLWRLLGLERLRAEAPELFDGRLAREAAEAAIAAEVEQ